MYTPAAFAEDDPAVLAGWIRAHPLGLLISGPDLHANLIPFDMGDDGLLRAHLARANPQVDALRASPEVLVVFQPGDAYVHPGWYPAKADHGRVVPTWNYAMVQARGRARVVEDAVWLHDQITALTAAQEAGRADPWTVGDAPPAFIAAQMRGILGIEITLTSLRGKAKLSQNRAQADRAGVRRGLIAEGEPLARLMPDDPA